MYPKATDVFNSFKMFGLSNEKPILALKNQVAAKKKGQHNIFGAHHLSPVSAARLIEPYCDTEIKI